MESLLAARSTMAISLGFHIVFAITGMIFPLLMAHAHYKWLKTSDNDYLILTKWWMRGLGIFFATGAVSGTALSFELGLLWPTFMKHAGPIFGMPFSWEGTAFFLEAIFLGLYLYGFNHLKPWTHWLAGLGVGICGVASGIFVVAANSWMNAPAGFRWVDGKAFDIDPVAAMFNSAWFSQAQHTIVTANLAVSMAVIGIHSFFILRKKKVDLNLKALKIALPFFIASALLTPLSGDYAAKDVAHRQPIKLAAMEAHFDAERNAGIWIGGIPNVEKRTTHYGIKIPGLLSFLAYGNFEANVKGLNDFPIEEWPPIIPVHFAFQIMVAIGSLALFIAFIIIGAHLKKKNVFTNTFFLKILVFATPLGFIAVEAGWVVTEVGRQPWIIYNIFKTADAVTPMPGLEFAFATFSTLYLFLALVVSWLMWRQFKLFQSSDGKDEKGDGHA
jgi:cytochrome d ubiquinol oxidase subunit I